MTALKQEQLFDEIDVLPIDLKTKTKNAMVEQPDSDSLNYISEQLTILLIVNSLLIFGIPILIGGIYLFYRYTHDSPDDKFTHGIIIFSLLCLFGSNHHHKLILILDNVEYVGQH